MQQAPALPAELTIYTAADLRGVWLARLLESPPEPGDCWLMPAQAVDQVDAAGVQLLISLSHSLGRRQAELQLVDASAPLREACVRLGAARLLAPSEASA